MTYHAPLPRADTGEGVFHQHERRMGRAGWTKAQYLEAGRAEFDRLYTASRAPTEGQREHYAECFWLVNAPPARAANNGGLR
jgi:hypothetical protein